MVIELFGMGLRMDGSTVDGRFETGFRFA